MGIRSDRRGGRVLTARGGAACAADRDREPAVGSMQVGGTVDVAVTPGEHRLEVRPWGAGRVERDVVVEQGGCSAWRVTWSLGPSRNRLALVEIAPPSP